MFKNSATDIWIMRALNCESQSVWTRSKVFHWLTICEKWKKGMWFDKSLFTPWQIITHYLPQGDGGIRVRKAGNQDATRLPCKPMGAVLWCEVASVGQVSVHQCYVPQNVRSGDNYEYLI